MRLLIPAAAAAALAAICAAACASPPSRSERASRAAANPDTGLLTGTQLKAALAPASWFPAGFVVDPAGSADTGGRYQQPSPPAGTADCRGLDGTSWILLAGAGSVSFAQNDYSSARIGGQYGQEIDVYQGAGAGAVMAGLRRLSVTCPSFTDTRTGGDVAVTMTPGPSLGDDAVTFTLRDPKWTGEMTLEAIRVGTAVVTVYYSAPSGSGQPQATSLATAITASLRQRI